MSFGISNLKKRKQNCFVCFSYCKLLDSSLLQQNTHCMCSIVNLKIWVVVCLCTLTTVCSFRFRWSFYFSLHMFFWDLKKNGKYVLPWYLRAFVILCAEACQAGVWDSSSQKHRHEWRGKGQGISARGEKETLWALQGRYLHLCKYKIAIIFGALNYLAKLPLRHTIHFL